jgi:K+-transporting ATPase KdpF subunit
MKTMIFTVVILSLEAIPAPAAMDNSNQYTLGAFIAFVLLAYLMYSLIKPEKF